jgi:hypothetical protein
MFAKAAVRADGTPQNNAGLGHRGSDDRRILHFLGKALMENVGFSSPRRPKRLSSMARR